MSELLTFLGAVLRSPGGVGAVAPSSRALGRCMVEAAAPAAGHTVVELGAGTGPVTEVLADVVDPARLLVLEPDAELAARCRARVPGVDVQERFAQELPALVAERGWSGVDRVVSSLPFAAWSPSLQTEVFDAIEAVLAPDGRLVTFTYAHSPWLAAGRRARATLEARFAQVRTTPVVWGNVPPAFVYVCDRR
ncbi:MAG: methyltransferase domain-containing protein [Myxococcales bacterium]|nr:methyltransferase domain-containing protein [Myxococcales bacterium]MCB9663896.1 methyltransferase domain-containing protein [Alphaproteobacteria bacterium]